jgi:hypothetical protein
VLTVASAVFIFGPLLLLPPPLPPQPDNEKTAVITNSKGNCFKYIIIISCVEWRLSLGLS